MPGLALVLAVQQMRDCSGAPWARMAGQDSVCLLQATTFPRKVVSLDLMSPLVTRGTKKRYHPYSHVQSIKCFHSHVHVLVCQAHLLPAGIARDGLHTFARRC